MKLFHGYGGESRVVQLKTGSGFTTHPITKLCPLETNLEVHDRDGASVSAHFDNLTDLNDISPRGCP